MVALSSARDEALVSIVDGYVANALAGPNSQPFWAEGYASAIRWVRRAHRLAGDDPPTIDRIAVVVARPVELLQLVARAALDSQRGLADPDVERVELLRWHRRDWLGLDPALRRGIAEGLRLAADTPVATRLRRVDAAFVPQAPVIHSVQSLPIDTLYFGAWTGEAPRWDGWLIEPAAAAGLRVAREMTGTGPSPAASAGPAAPTALESLDPLADGSAPHGYKGAARLVDDLERKVDRVVRAARAAGAESARARSARTWDSSVAQGLALRLRDAQSALSNAAGVAGEAAAALVEQSAS